MTRLRGYRGIVLEEGDDGKGSRKVNLHETGRGGVGWTGRLDAGAALRL